MSSLLYMVSETDPNLQGIRAAVRGRGLRDP
jgi:hypothetical protein